MLIEISAKEFRHYFGSDPHPFSSEPFMQLNARKADRIVRLVEEKEKFTIGLIAGIKDGILKAPFSAPFAGFHYRNESIYVDEIESFLEGMKEYLKKNELKQLCFTFPPALYKQSFNAKAINAMIRLGFKMDIPEITNWVDLKQFNHRFSHRNSREYYQQAIKNQLTFNILDDHNDRRVAFELICENRARFGRPIYMSLDDISQMGELCPVDFFSVNDSEGSILASGIFYRFPNNISFAVFWGDNMNGRPLRAMDFLAYNLWSHYKSLGFEYIDIGISTETGIPNEGLLRFKETHEAISSLRYSFTWDA